MEGGTRLRGQPLRRLVGKILNDLPITRVAALGRLCEHTGLLDPGVLYIGQNCINIR